MKLIVITPPGYFEGEAELINQLFGAGLQLLHLRKQENDEEKFRQLMMEIAPVYYPLISIHQHHELAAEFSLKRFHYPEQQRKTMSVAKMKMLAEEGFRLSSSVHDISILPDLQYLDYVFFGPVFNSISKTGYNSRLEPDFILPPHIVKVFAVGGITAERFWQLKQMNFDGAAVLGALWHQPVSPVIEFKRMLNHKENS